MYYYHMTSLNNLRSISKQGLIPQSGVNSKLIGDEKIKVFFSEGFEGAIALFVDFQIVYDNVRAGQMTTTDEDTMKKIMDSKSLSEYLGEGVYLRFDGTEIENQRNFENGCTDMTIPPEKLMVCILRRNDDHSVVYSRFEIMKYMMTQIQPEHIKYSGADYEGAPDVAEATHRIQEKVKRYYKTHQNEISAYESQRYKLEFWLLDDFVHAFL